MLKRKLSMDTILKIFDLCSISYTHAVIVLFAGIVLSCIARATSAAEGPGEAFIYITSYGLRTACYFFAVVSLIFMVKGDIAVSKQKMNEQTRTAITENLGGKDNVKAMGDAFKATGVDITNPFATADSVKHVSNRISNNGIALLSE